MKVVKASLTHSIERLKKQQADNKKVFDYKIAPIKKKIQVRGVRLDISFQTSP